MTTPGHDHHDSEPDPTGVRALLSSLPDPGPMPEELVTRITASLQQEQRLRERRSADDEAPGVISLDTERARRRPGRTVSALGAAAAVAVAATVAVSQMLGGGTPEMTPAAQYGLQDSGGSDAGAADEDDAAQGDGAERPAQEHEESAAEEPAEGESGAGALDGAAETATEAPPGLAGREPQVHVVPALIALSRSGFAEELLAELALWQETVPSAAGEDGMLGTQGAMSCTRSVPEVLEPSAEVFIAGASLDGEDAVVLVQTRPAPVTAWVLPASCARGPADLLHGPVTLD